ncbi:MAG: phosphate transporter [Verrucomicrobia bacterium]|jgi:PiT family inorganic phosphate transporter|nr:phosphate transporter [Verrucomicrobiota bacterium]
MIWLLFLATCFLAYSNGANDNFKGVASLFGSKTASYRTAIWWATVTTFAGSVCSLVFAEVLLKKFSGKGLVPDALVGSELFLLAVAAGAGLTVIIATVTGFPISTTHGLTGAIIGSGLMAVGTEVNFQSLGKGFLLPLLLSPVVAVLLAAPLYLGLRYVRLRLGITKEWCLCVGETQQVIPIPQPGSLMALQVTAPPKLEVCAGEEQKCLERYAGAVWGIKSQKVMDAAHFLSAGVVSFARGLNDTPKIAALLLVIQVLDIRYGLMAVGLFIAIGGLLNAKKVAETMSHKITTMNHGQGFAANLSTGILVIAASKYGLPVSTTHVSVGSLFGIGLTTGKLNTKVILGILLSWVLTMPCAALLAAVVYWMVK